MMGFALPHTRFKRKCQRQVLRMWCRKVPALELICIPVLASHESNNGLCSIDLLDWRLGLVCTACTNRKHLDEGWSRRMHHVEFGKLPNVHVLAQNAIVIWKYISSQTQNPIISLVSTWRKSPIFPRMRPNYPPLHLVWKLKEIDKVFVERSYGSYSF